jgi:sensor histidine kinase YesM
LKNRLKSIKYASLTALVAYPAFYFYTARGKQLQMFDLYTFLMELPLSLLISNGIWLGIPIVLRKAGKNLKTAAEPQKAIIYNSLLIGVYALSVFCFLVYSTTFIRYGYIPTVNNIMPAFTVCLLVLVFFQLVYLGKYFFKRWKMLQLEAEVLKREKVISELEALKVQVNPHFLFNSFSTLSALIEEDPKAAQEMVQELSFIYRYVLQSNNKSLIKLEEELEFIKALSFILQKRYGQHFKIDLQIDNSARENYILPLSLQMLVENAIKHNVVSPEKPLEIKIHSETPGFLTIENNLQLKNRVSGSGEIGLNNINGRYKILASKKVVIEKTDKYFKVGLPLINKTDYGHIDN